MSATTTDQSQCLTFAAFDKGDLLYLRDEEEKRRFTEMELRDSERQQFMKERARVEAERAAAALRAAQARKEKASRYSARMTKQQQQEGAILNVVQQGVSNSASCVYSQARAKI